MKMYPVLIRFFILFFTLFFTGSAVADFKKISAAEAHELTKDGKVLLIDIRYKREWQQTGVAPQAITLTMHQPGGLPEFVEKLEERLKADNKNKNTPIALICAGGVRSNYAQSFLQRQGFTHVLDVKEGMLGGLLVKGWIDQNLPIKKYSSN